MGQQRAALDNQLLSIVINQLKTQMSGAACAQQAHRLPTLAAHRCVGGRARRPSPKNQTTLQSAHSQQRATQVAGPGAQHSMSHNETKASDPHGRAVQQYSSTAVKRCFKQLAPPEQGRLGCGPRRTAQHAPQRNKALAPHGSTAAQQYGRQCCSKVLAPLEQGRPGCGPG